VGRQKTVNFEKVMEATNDNNDKRRVSIIHQVPMTEDIAYFQSLIEMQDWKRGLHVANMMKK